MSVDDCKIPFAWSSAKSCLEKLLCLYFWKLCEKEISLLNWDLLGYWAWQPMIEKTSICVCSTDIFLSNLLCLANIIPEIYAYKQTLITKKDSVSDVRTACYKHLHKVDIPFSDYF